MSVQFITTNVGRAKLAASGIGNVTLAHFAFSSDFLNVTENLTAIPNIFKTTPISGENISGTSIHFSTADTSNDAYIVKTIGVYLSDGTLFAAYSQNTPIFEKVANTDSVISFDTILIDLTDANFSFPDLYVSNPPATTQKRGVIEIATPAETLAATDTERAITPALLKAYIDQRIADGINAARLGGELPAHYKDIPARLGYVPANVDALNGMWTSFNDGPNSGLDADTIWGKLPSEFVLLNSFENNKSNNGYIKLPNGLILQWFEGEPIPAGEATRFIGFPIAFPNACLNCMVSTIIAMDTDSDPYFQIIGTPTKTGVSVKRQLVSGMRDWASSKPSFMAIGH